MMGTTGRAVESGSTDMSELLIDFITSLDGYGAADGWRAGGASRGPSTSRGWARRRKRGSTILIGR